MGSFIQYIKQGDWPVYYTFNYGVEEDILAGTANSLFYTTAEETGGLLYFWPP